MTLCMFQIIFKTCKKIILSFYLRDIYYNLILLLEERLNLEGQLDSVGWKKPLVKCSRPSVSSTLLTDLCRSNSMDYNGNNSSTKLFEIKCVGYLIFVLCTYSKWIFVLPTYRILDYSVERILTKFELLNCQRSLIRLLCEIVIDVLL